MNIFDADDSVNCCHHLLLPGLKLS